MYSLGEKLGVQVSSVKVGMQLGAHVVHFWCVPSSDVSTVHVA